MPRTKFSTNTMVKRRGVRGRERRDEGHRVETVGEGGERRDRGWRVGDIGWRGGRG